MKNLFFGIFLAAYVVSNSVLAQDCSVIRNASQQDIAKGEAVTLLNNMAGACKSQIPENFFRLQTSEAQRLVSGVSDKASLFKNYCEFTAEAIKTLGGNTAMGTHSIGPYKNRSKCGAPASYWFIYTKDGTLALRMEVAVESGSLKIDTH